MDVCRNLTQDLLHVAEVFPQPGQACEDAPSTFQIPQLLNRYESLKNDPSSQNRFFMRLPKKTEITDTWV